MKKISLCLAIIVFAVNSFSQNNDSLQTVPNFKRHSIYVELLGNSFFYSVNYDYLFRIYKDNIKPRFRIRQKVLSLHFKF